jgi:CheY-like chemotaxis protein
MAKTKILIVDDELFGRQLLQAVLLPEGYEIFLAENGNEAIEIAQTNLPNLVLMDVMMPGMDGYMTVKKMKEVLETKNIPVIMVTALEDRDSRIKGLEAGAVDYITKPFDRIEVINKVKNNTSTINTIPQEEITKTGEKPQKNDSIVDSLVTEILSPNNVIENYTGPLEFSFLKTEHLSILGQWTHKNANYEFIAFFGPETPNENTNFKNCLISMWLWNCSGNMSSDPSNISNFIQSKMKSSGFFDQEKHPWWFMVIVINGQDSISGTGFNKPVFVLPNKNSENSSKHFVMNTQGNQLMRFSKNDLVFLLSNEITRKLEDSFTIELLKKHISQPESATLNSIHKSLFEKVESTFSFGLKIGF